MDRPRKDELHLELLQELESIRSQSAKLRRRSDIGRAAATTMALTWSLHHITLAKQALRVELEAGGNTWT